MLTNFMNTTIHPVGTLGILEWMLWRWQLNPSARLLIIVPKGESKDVMNRVRVTLSRIREDMKRGDIADMQHFGISASHSSWTDQDGVQSDALYVNRFVEKTHTMSEIFASMGFSKKEKLT